mmetsp:Transcript_25410/g.35178  ORF Transcript_25410/g.35178 Transcript_25410/m.35178 type:complete len:350 (+) Transcript_25410:104-1153(+)
MNSIILKLQCAGVVRRCQLKGRPVSMGEVHRLIDAIGVPPRFDQLCYFDDEGDCIHVTTDWELKEAVHFHWKQQPSSSIVLRFHLLEQKEEEKEEEEKRVRIERRTFNPHDQQQQKKDLEERSMASDNTLNPPEAETPLSPPTTTTHPQTNCSPPSPEIGRYPEEEEEEENDTFFECSRCKEKFQEGEARFRCISCDNYILCASCLITSEEPPCSTQQQQQQQQQHDLSHPFLKLVPLVAAPFPMNENKPSCDDHNATTPDNPSVETADLVGATEQTNCDTTTNKATEETGTGNDQVEEKTVSGLPLKRVQALDALLPMGFDPLELNQVLDRLNDDIDATLDHFLLMKK